MIVFPGWFVANSGGFRDLWVLEPKALPSFLQNEPARLSPEDVKLASFHFIAYRRTIFSQESYNFRPIIGHIMHPWISLLSQ